MKGNFGIFILYSLYFCLIHTFFSYPIRVDNFFLVNFVFFLFAGRFLSEDWPKILPFVSPYIYFSFNLFFSDFFVELKKLLDLDMNLKKTEFDLILLIIRFYRILVL